MNLTEDEAKQRWCPFARVGFGGRFGNAAFNRFQITGQTAAGQVVDEGELKIPAGAKCLGSACMAWRRGIDTTLARPFVVTLPGTHGPTAYAWDPTGHPGYEHATIEPARTAEPNVGRCGLAD